MDDIDKAYEEEKAKLDRSVTVLCHWGNCVHWVDPVTNKIEGGAGPVTCPCDHVAGWKSTYLEGQARPGVPTKAKGRYGSRVQRSRRRKDMNHGWRKEFGRTFDGWLPPHSLSS